MLKNKNRVSKSSLKRLSLDKKAPGQLQVLSLRHPHTADDKAPQQSPSNFLWNPKSSFLKRTQRMTNMRSSLVDMAPKDIDFSSRPELSPVTIILPKDSDPPLCEMRSIEQNLVMGDDSGRDDLETPIWPWKDDPYLYSLNQTQNQNEELMTPRLPSHRSQPKTVLSVNSKKSEMNSFVCFESPNVDSVKAVSKKRLSTLQKKLKKQQKTKSKKLQTWTRSSNQSTPNAKSQQLSKPDKSHKRGSTNPIPQATLSNIIIRSFKKHTKKLNRRIERVDPSSLKINLTRAPQTTKDTSIQHPEGPESSMNCSIEAPEKYMSSCNLVSTNRMETMDISTHVSNMNLKSVYKPRRKSMERSVCFQSQQRNEVTLNKSEFLKNKHNIDSKIALIDQKLRQIDEKLSTMHSCKNPFASTLFTKKKYSVKSAISAKIDRKQARPPKLVIHTGQRKKGLLLRSGHQVSSKAKQSGKLSGLWQKSPLSASLHSRRPAPSTKSKLAKAVDLSRVHWSNPCSLKSTFRSKKSDLRESSRRDSTRRSYEVNSIQSKHFINL